MGEISIRKGISLPEKSIVKEKGSRHEGWIRPYMERE
jgi:hypothetical protein